MAVKFSMPEPFLFFILEKSGLMRIFSNNFTPSTSLSFLNGCKDPSLDADWFATDPTHVAVASGGRIHHWNLDSMRYHLPYYPPPPLINSNSDFNQIWLEVYWKLLLWQERRSRKLNSIPQWRTFWPCWDHQDLLSPFCRLRDRHW